MGKYIVFDLDGTLSDTQKIHQKIESDFLQKKWVEITPQNIWIRYAWRTPQERITELLTIENKTFTIEEIKNFVLQKDAIIITLLEKWEIELMPYAFETLNYLYQKKYKIGISSWACREFIDKFITYFGLEDIITASTSANEVEKKKPHPDVFLNCFSKIEKKHRIPSAKYVVWDWRSDMEWWHKAWAITIRLNYLQRQKPNDQYCNFEVTSLKGLQEIL